jgi:[acyl-carrier-protein] S-malonyltransferase
MRRFAFIFPGQGSQSVGMGRALYERFHSAREVFKEAADVLGFDVAKLCFEGPRAELDKTENTQPAILTACVAALRALNGEFPYRPGYVAGHSLGEYTALVAAGVLSFRDAVRLVRLRGRFMQESAASGKMCAVIGLDCAGVKEACTEASKEGVCVPANINSPEQVVISGETAAVERASEIAKKKGARRVMPLPVSVASHSPLMEKAAFMLEAELKKMELGRFAFPLLSNVTAAAVEDPAMVAGLLREQLVSPVRWVEIVEGMKDRAVEVAVEVGPGSVLSGLVKRITDGIMPVGYASPEDISKVKEAVGA